MRQVDDRPPLVDGLRLIERTDEAGSGEVWRARLTGGIGGARGDALPGDLPGVGECLVRLVRLPVDESIRGRARVLAQDLVALDDPGLVAIREVRRADDGVALILAAQPSPLMALRLLARRRQLAAGEIITLGVALSWGLETAHAAGVMHGRLRDGDVLLDPVGQPRLAGVGLMGVLGSPGDPADDVRALARMLGSLLDRSSPGAGAVMSVLGDHAPAGAATSAGGLAADLADAAPAAPIRLPDASAGSAADETSAAAPAGDPRWRWRRVAVLLSGAVAIVVLSGVVGWVSAPAPSGGHLPPVAATPDWRRVMEGLDSARAAAFADPFGASLSRVDAPGTPALASDSASLSALRGRGAHSKGLRIMLDQVDAASRSERQVTLAVTDRLLPYALLDSSGRVLSEVPGRGVARHLITLRDVGTAGHSSWRVATVVELPPAPSS